MELITTHKAIASKINGLGKRLKNIDSDTHVIAVSAIHHALDHNRNWELVTQLIKVVGNYDEAENKFKSRAVRVQDMRSWLGKNLPVRWEHKKGVGRYVTDKTKLASFDAEVCRANILTPWYEAIEDKASEFKGFDMEARVKKLIADYKKAEKKAAEHGELAQAKVKRDISDNVMKDLMALVDFDGLLELDGETDKAA